MQQKELKQGITEAVPIVLGYLPAGLVHLGVCQGRRGCLWLRQS
ncbi:hypothetical protein [Syntrophaceticus schinkii]|nr:hypothetical protein [Syntrophaceticus schinkii]